MDSTREVTCACPVSPIEMSQLTIHSIESSPCDPSEHETDTYAIHLFILDNGLTIGVNLNEFEHKFEYLHRVRQFESVNNHYK